MHRLLARLLPIALILLASGIASSAFAASAQAVPCGGIVGPAVDQQQQECEQQPLECAAGQALVDGKCVTPTPTCEANQTLVAGACVQNNPCAAGETLVGTACMAPANCDPGQIQTNGVCTADPNAGIALSDGDAFVEINAPIGDGGGAVAAEVSAPQATAAVTAAATSQASGTLPVTGLAQQLLAAAGMVLVLAGIGFYVVARGGASR